MAFVGTQAVNMRSLTGSWASGQGPDRVRARTRVRDEMRLEVTASELHSLSFQKRLAEFSAKGIPVQVSLVNDPAPVPQTPAASALPLLNPIGRVSVPGQVAGTGLSMLGGLLGATGAVLLNQALKIGPGPLAELIGQQGLQELLPMVTQLDLTTAAAAAITGVATAFGGMLIGFKAGEFLRRLTRPSPAPAAPPRPARPNRPMRTLQNAIGGWTGLFCSVGGATGGFVAGHLVANAVGAGSPLVLGAAIAGATLVGTMSLLGGWQMGKALF